MKVLKTQSTINIGRECGEAQVANTLALMWVCYSDFKETIEEWINETHFPLPFCISYYDILKKSFLSIGNCKTKAENKTIRREANGKNFLIFYRVSLLEVI